MRPQGSLAQLIPVEQLKGGAQRGVGIQYARGDLLKELRIFGADMEFAKLNLGPGPGQGFGALKRRFAAQLVDQAQGLCATRADAGPKRGVDGSALLDSS